MADPIDKQQVAVQAGAATLEGDLWIPRDAEFLVLFAHGSGSSRFSTRNRMVASVLNEAGCATLLFDLLTPEEQAVDEQTRRLRFDIELLADRLIGAVDWAMRQPMFQDRPLGLFGASTGAAAALTAAAHRPDAVGAVVSRGGRPDLAGSALSSVRAPTLLIVGGDDPVVIELNRKASAVMRTEHQLAIVPGATHLFEEPGTLERVAELARDWFTQHLGRKRE